MFWSSCLHSYFSAFALRACFKRVRPSWRTTEDVPTDIWNAHSKLAQNGCANRVKGIQINMAPTQKPESQQWLQPRDLAISDNTKRSSKWKQDEKGEAFHRATC